MTLQPTYRPGDFDIAAHYYERVRNAQLHPLVRSFLALGHERIASRYVHLHPTADRAKVLELLASTPRRFRWGGADLFLATNERGLRQMVVIETNSSPSGQKSMPTSDETDELGGYRRLVAGALLPAIDKKRKKRLPAGELAVLYDKNPMESSGYAATMAELTGEPVHLVPCFRGAEDPPWRFEDGVLHVRVEGSWRPIRAAMRYVTQQPWNRLPPVTKTLIFNPTLACLAGGRNKAMAAKAYEFFNAEMREHGLRIRMPETIWDVARAEVPWWVQRMGGVAVVKNPYSNAGQGVYTITSDAELEAFMESEQRYDRFIVQALIGNLRWSSHGRAGRLYHVGTVPDKRARIYAADLRFMVGGGPSGFFPVAIYARRARKPLEAELPDGASSWEMLGTNLSVKLGENEWKSETERLLLVDSRDFNKLGIGVDDLIEGYLQTVMAVTAIDRMAGQLLTKKGVFRRRFFREMNPDPALADEIAR
ncbi:MAG TPA: hypothetical protein RMH85_19860 [Polyangiaceae bacterium LLY-WYZ-15_(1-7)]|nr:hypothetical protein [Myxococcales bacterium]MAT27429.1 hypothetical protein [Sandaracinus sp.]HJK90522.1 hypothetical protein [Polyangiaceae bacterium LLY-WYZ-15_(1-7)]MBJ74559.1 hypothetical protein [Sandaracinus sp.]HJL05582.1 hypothetical protein [Polyangiaceae bacterium LLY-WYZ-15_(1-7)]